MSILDLKAHYLYGVYQGRKLLYVGRSMYPRSRHYSFERRTGLCETRLKILVAGNLDCLQDLERKYIAIKRPPYNLIVQSSKGRVGKLSSAETIAKQVASNVGKTRTAASKQRISDAITVGFAKRRRQGLPIGAAMVVAKTGHGPAYGKPKSEEHKQKLREANEATWATKTHSPKLIKKLRTLAKAQYRDPTTNRFAKCKF